MKSHGCLFAFILLALLTSACGTGNVSVSYHPVGLPIVLSLNDLGELSVGASASVITPVGEFELQATLPRVDERAVLLILRDTHRTPPDKVFRVEVGRNIAVTTNGRTRIIVSPDGYVIIDVTDGTTESIEIYDADVVQFGDDGRPLCGGFPSIHQIGETVIVDLTPIGALRVLRYYTGGANDTIVQAYDNDRLELRDGPICYGSVWYWKVYFAKRNTIGWVAERVRTDLYLCPTYQPECG